MSKNTVTDIVLQGQSNWELWFFVVKRIAEAGDVWEYIDPNQLLRPLQKPERPVRPAPIVNADGSPPTQPTQQALIQYNQDLSNYYKDIKEYRRLKDKLGQVEAHITKTIQQDLLYHIKDKSNLRDQIKTLQELYSPTTADQEYRVQKAYEAAKVLHPRGQIDDADRAFDNEKQAIFAYLELPALVIKSDVSILPTRAYLIALRPIISVTRVQLSFLWKLVNHVDCRTIDVYRLTTYRW
jgi:hypothetical protein